MDFVNTWGGEEYINLVRQVVNDDDLSYFKSNRDYKGILEHCGYNEALYYYDLLMQRIKNGEIIDNKLIDKFKENDKLGAGDTIECEYFGKIGRSTLKYAVIAYQLKDLVNHTKDLKVLEIGGGYGGQMKLMCDILDISEIFMIDIPVVLELQKKYLNYHKIKANTVHPYKVESLYNTEFDLVVSNHAVCELEKTIQDSYIPLINSSQHGYILYHNEESWNGSYSIQEFCSNINQTPTGDYFCESPIISW